MCIVIRRVGTAIRLKYHWFLLTIILHQVLDNAGGHGNDDCVPRYVVMLKMKFNIECIHQVHCSLFTNVIDLGVWTTFQSGWYFMKRCHIEVLVSTVMTIWDEAKLDQQIKMYQKDSKRYYASSTSAKVVMIW